MDTTAPESGEAIRPANRAEWQQRIAWEAERIAQADADVQAGRLVDSADVKRWIDSIGTDHELPVPYSGC
jgi:predicted transcriptional regulator